MADDQRNDSGKKPEEKRLSSDSGLGNLPPLSDFDSQSGLGTSDSGLPPLGSFDSDTAIAGDERISSDGGLPPISDIDVVTPQPTGGNIRPAPAGFESGPFASSGPSFMDTPARGNAKPGGSGFQDLAADSDFSPETPEIGPGPGADSGMDTPMFDSAFGGGAGFDVSLKTPAPTQAMETPMFGGSQAPMGGKGMESAGFGAGLDFTGGGTPPPDFSPDTDLRQPVTPAGIPEAGGKKAKKGGGGSPMTAVIIGIAALVIGIIAGPYVSGYLPLPNPQSKQIAEMKKTIDAKDGEIRSLTNIRQNTGNAEISQEKLDKLRADIESASGELKTAQTNLETTSTQLTEKQTTLQAVEADIAAKNEEFVTAQEMYQDLQNETAIVKARQSGLLAEVDRLTNYVGQLDEANARRIASKEALEHNIDRLIIQIKEGMPLTPEKYSHAARLAAAETLRDKAGEAKWITPELQQGYTDLYLKELEIASKQEYFFAKLPVHDALGNKTDKWCECLMKGNWGVYYRSLDGKSVGVYQNTAEGLSAPVWGVRESLPDTVRAEVEQEVMAARVPDFEAKVRVLAEKQLAMEDGTALQRNFDSL